MKIQHVTGGVEIFLLAALPAWLQSPSGKSFMTTHGGICDLVLAAYVGLRAVKMALETQAPNPTAPAQAPAEPQL